MCKKGLRSASNMRATRLVSPTGMEPRGQSSLKVPGVRVGRRAADVVLGVSHPRNILPEEPHARGADPNLKTAVGIKCFLWPLRGRPPVG